MTSPGEGGAGNRPTQLADVETIEVEPPQAPPLVSEKAATRRYIAYAITLLVFLLFGCVSYRYISSKDATDRQDFIHLFEILLTVYGTILGFYFGSQE